MAKSEVIIRKAIKADANAAWLIRNASINKQCAGHYPPASLKVWTDGELSKEFIAIVESNFYVATFEGEVVGTGMIDLESGKVDAIFIHPQKMGTGLGSQILSYLESLATEAGLAEMSFDSTLDAVNFYRSFGFVGESTSSYQSSKGVTLACIPMIKRIRK